MNCCWEDRLSERTSVKWPIVCRQFSQEHPGRPELDAIRGALKQLQVLERVLISPYRQKTSRPPSPSLERWPRVPCRLRGARAPQGQVCRCGSKYPLGEHARDRGGPHRRQLVLRQSLAGPLLEKARGGESHPLSFAVWKASRLFYTIHPELARRRVRRIARSGLKARGRGAGIERLARRIQDDLEAIAEEVQS